MSRMKAALGGPGNEKDFKPIKDVNIPVTLNADEFDGPTIRVKAISNIKKSEKQKKKEAAKEIRIVEQRNQHAMIG